MRKLITLLLTLMSVVSFATSGSAITTGSSVEAGFRTLTKKDTLNPSKASNEADVKFKANGKIHITYYVRTDLNKQTNGGVDTMTLDQFKNKYIGSELHGSKTTFNPSTEGKKHWGGGQTATTSLLDVSDGVTYINEHSGEGIDDVSVSESEISAVVLLLDLYNIDKNTMDIVQEFIKQNKLRGAQFKLITFSSHHYIDATNKPKNPKILKTYDWIYDNNDGPVLPMAAVYKDDTLSDVANSSNSNALMDTIFGDNSQITTSEGGKVTISGSYASTENKYYAGGSNGIWALYLAYKYYGDLPGKKEVVLISKQHLDIDRTSMIGLQPVVGDGNLLYIQNGAVTSDMRTASVFNWWEGSTAQINPNYLESSKLGVGSKKSNYPAPSSAGEAIHTKRKVASINRIVNQVRDWFGAKKMTLRSVYPHGDNQKDTSGTGTTTELISDPAFLFKKDYRPASDARLTVAKFYDDLTGIDGSILRNLDGTKLNVPNDTYSPIRLFSKEHLNNGGSLAADLQIGLSPKTSGGPNIGTIFTVGNQKITMNYGQAPTYSNPLVSVSGINTANFAESMADNLAKYERMVAVLQAYRERMLKYYDADGNPQYYTANELTGDKKYGYIKITKKLQELELMKATFENSPTAEINSLYKSGVYLYKVIGDNNNKILMVYFPKAKEGDTTGKTAYGVIGLQCRADGFTPSPEYSASEKSSLIEAGARVVSLVPYLGADWANENATTISSSGGNKDTGEISLTELTAIGNVNMYDYEIGETQNGVYNALKDIDLGPTRQYWEIVYEVALEHAKFDGKYRSIDGVVNGLNKLGKVNAQGGIDYGQLVHPYLFYSLPKFTITNLTSKKVFEGLKDIQNQKIYGTDDAKRKALYQIESSMITDAVNIGIKNGDIIELSNGSASGQFKVSLQRAADGTVESIGVVAVGAVTGITLNEAKGVISQLDKPVVPSVSSIKNLDSVPIGSLTLDNPAYVGIRSRQGTSNDAYKLELTTPLLGTDIGVIIKVRYDGKKSDYGNDAVIGGLENVGDRYIFVPKNSRGFVELKKYEINGTRGIDGEYKILENVRVVNDAGEISEYLAQDPNTNYNFTEELAGFTAGIFPGTPDKLYYLDTMGPRLKNGTTGPVVKIANAAFDNTTYSNPGFSAAKVSKIADLLAKYDGESETALLDKGMNLPQINNGQYPVKVGDTVGVNVIDYNYVVGGESVKTPTELETKILTELDHSYAEGNIVANKYYSTNDEVAELRIKNNFLANNALLDMTSTTLNDPKYRNHLVIFNVTTLSKPVEVLTSDLARNRLAEEGREGFSEAPGVTPATGASTLLDLVSGSSTLVESNFETDVKNIDANEYFGMIDRYSKNIGTEEPRVLGDSKYKSVFTDNLNQHSGVVDDTLSGKLINYKPAAYDATTAAWTEGSELVVDANKRNEYLIKSYSIDGARRVDLDSIIYDQQIEPRTMDAIILEMSKNTTGHEVYEIKVPVEKFLELSGIIKLTIVAGGDSNIPSPAQKTFSPWYSTTLREGNADAFTNAKFTLTMNTTKNVYLVNAEIEDRVGNKKPVVIRILRPAKLNIISKQSGLEAYKDKKNETKVEMTNKIKIRAKK